MSIKREYDFPQVGQKDMYLLHHEEIESLAKNIPGVKRIRFFMTFGQSYLTHMKMLGKTLGLLRTDAIYFNGQEIVPIQFLKALLPDPASLGPRTVGKTNIGCILQVSKMVLKRLSTSTMFATIRSATQKLVHRLSLTQQVFLP